MCSRPRNPHRNPKPSACEVSGSHTSEASFSESFSRASRRSGYSSESTGNSPQNTIGLASRYPGSGAWAGEPARVSVSPTRRSTRLLRPVTTYPLSPADRCPMGVITGDITPTSSAAKSDAVAIARTCWPARISPSTTRTNATTPRYWSYTESNTRARSGAAGSPAGGGMRVTMASRTSFTPCPVFAEMRST